MNYKALQDVAGLSDLGLTRQVNEDALLISEDIGLYAIADGMGGHGSGDVASKLALSSLQDVVMNQRQSVTGRIENCATEPEQQILEAILDANKSIHEQNVLAGHSNGTGMGTTLVGFIKTGVANRAISFNVGDSRLYEFRAGVLKQMTEDHTLYHHWLANGRRGPEPSPHIILRAMGLFDEIEVDIRHFTLHKDATYLLCSDGLSGMVEDDAIAQTLANDTKSTSELCEQLVLLANENGGQDNISVVLLRAGSDAG